LKRASAKPQWSTKDWLGRVVEDMGEEVSVALVAGGDEIICECPGFTRSSSPFLRLQSNSIASLVRFRFDRPVVVERSVRQLQPPSVCIGPVGKGDFQKGTESTLGRLHLGSVPA